MVNFLGLYDAWGSFLDFAPSVHEAPNSGNFLFSEGGVWNAGAPLTTFLTGNTWAIVIMLRLKLVYVNVVLQIPRQGKTNLITLELYDTTTIVDLF